MSAGTRRRLWLALGAVLCCGGAVAEDNCLPGDVLYMALEPVKELVGFSGETRAQFLERRYHTWQEDNEQIIRGAAAGGETIRVTLNPPDGQVLEHADIIVESRFDYVDGDGARKPLTGHREIARYPLAAADTSAEIAVPRSAFREPGALLVVVLVRGNDGAQSTIVGAVPVELNFCPRRVYTHDRFTAIRLNRREAGPK